MKGTVDERAGQLLEEGPGEFELDVEGLALGGHGDEGNVEGGLLAGGEVALRPFREVLDALHGHRVPGQVNAGFGRKVREDVVDEGVVEVDSPRKMSPPVAFTSKTRSRISMMLTSKVPPPKS